MLIKRQKNNNMPRSIDKRILNIKTLNDLDLMSEGIIFIKYSPL